MGPEENPNVAVQGIGEMSVGATIHALRTVKGASTIPADQQVLSGAVENYRSNLLLTMLASGVHSYISDGLPKAPGQPPSITEQQMIMKELSVGSSDAEADIAALAGAFQNVFLYVWTNPFSRVPPPYYVLHHDSLGFRAVTQQTLGRFKTPRAA